VNNASGAIRPRIPNGKRRFSWSFFGAALAKSQIFRKRNLLILSARIRDSKVEAGMPSCEAAPNGPETRPPAAANAAVQAGPADRFERNQYRAAPARVFAGVVARQYGFGKP